MKTLAGKTFLKEVLDQEEVRKFLTFPDEELIIGQREHSAQLFIRLFEILMGTLFVTALFTGLSYFF